MTFKARLILLAWSIAGMLALMGCAQERMVLPANLPQVTVYPQERAPCDRPAKPNLKSLPPDKVASGLAAFSINQEAAISVCEVRKDEGVAIRDAYNKAITDLLAAQKHKKFLGLF